MRNQAAMTAASSKCGTLRCFPDLDMVMRRDICGEEMDLDETGYFSLLHGKGGHIARMRKFLAEAPDAS